MHPKEWVTAAYTECPKTLYSVLVYVTNNANGKNSVKCLSTSKAHHLPCAALNTLETQDLRWQPHEIDINFLSDSEKLSHLR